MDKTKTAKKPAKQWYKRKALMPADPELTEPTVVSPFCLTEKQKRVEQVGSFYEDLKKRHARMWKRVEKDGASARFTDSEPEEDEKAKVDEESKDKVEGEGNTEDYEKKRRKRTKEDIEREALEKGDLYALLGLEDKTYEAGENDIRRAYQKIALKCHPDKLMDAYDEKAKVHWLKIQDAYELLSDPAKRKKYDSTLPFDDALPSKSDVTTDESFFEVFAAVFNRNSRFAKKRPTPNLGDLSTEMKEVQKFYKYWDNFDSWREFSQYDEYDPAEAQDRYERRYMEQENKKLRAQYERKERARLIKLSEMAYNLDPRIRKERELAEAEKLRKKEEKRNYKAAEARKLEQAVKDAQQKKEDEAIAKADKDKREREERKQIQLAFKAKCKELIDLCTEKLKGTNYDRFWVESIQKKFNNVDKVQPLIDFLQSCSSKEQWIEWITMQMMNEEDRKKAELALIEKKAKEAEQVQDDGSGWSKEEVALLTKSIVKFAPGTKDRWLTIAQAVETKSQKECIKKAQEIAKKREMDQQEKREKQDMLNAQKAQAEKEKQKPTVVKVKRAPVQEEEEKKEAPVAEAAPEGDSWTAEQQKQMEQGMKSVSSSLATKVRWIAIAELVDGKNAKDCFTRYKEIVAKLKK